MADEVAQRPGNTSPPEVSTPIVIDLGKVRRKKIKQLRRGRGKLMTEVQQALGEVIASLGNETAGKELLPVVLVYSKKRKGSKYKGGFPILPIPPFFG